jgi:hypothetical protein
VDGETVWEKLRTIRIHLDDRKRAYELAILAREKIPEAGSYEYKQYLINKEFEEGLVQDCANEVKFLTEFEAYLSAEAEKTRLTGKTDDEMYELNFFHELEVRLVRKAQAQIASSGRIDEELMLRLMKNKSALRICVQQGLLAQDIFTFVDTPLLPSTDIHTVKFLEVKNND